MSPGPTTLESRLAQIIRLTCSDREGEVISAIHAIVRTLKAAGTDKIHALADRVEKPIGKPKGNAFNEAEARRLYNEGYAAGVRAAESKHHGASDFHGIDGKPNWEDVALFCQQEKRRLDARHHEFIDDMACRTVYGREPTEKQHKYLHSFSSNLARKSHERASRRDDRSSVHRDHQRPRRAGHQRRGSDRRSAVVSDQSAR